MSSSPTVSRIIRTRSLWPGQSANGAATVTVTEQLQSTSTTNPYNNGRPTKLSNMLPGLIIAVFCFASVCIAAGLLRARLRRRRRVLGGDSRSVPSSASNSSNGGLKKKKTRPTKPQLWDVEVKDVNWAIDLEALHVR
ncbi:hypothetical protein BDW22DRAFT_1363347 [Trametopsis cervina]|nr:hypothetical protein BDW22DRAFT_1363347 [Trametopsis cervina]